MKKILNLILLVLSLNSFSQQSKQLWHDSNCKVKCHCPRGYSITEASKLKNIKGQFYKNKEGHLYIKTGSIRPGEKGELIEAVFFSSLISQKIDVATYKEFIDGSWYAKDKNQIYYSKGNSDGEHIWEIEDADVKTFKTLDTSFGSYAMDANHFYFGDQVLKGFRPNKTKFIRDSKGLIIELVQGKFRHTIE